MGTKLLGRAHMLGVGVAAGVFGGVAPGVHRGSSHSDSWLCDPWGWRGWSCGHSFWSPWCWWTYPWYFAWYYPWWWWYSRPYYYADYYYLPVTTVVYGQPQVTYLEQPAAEAAAEPAAGAAATGAVAPAQNPLSIAAQRYLELGDRAFREGRYTDAVQFYAKAVEFAPDQGALYLVLSDALFAAGDYHYAAYALRRALELDPALIESQIDKHAFYPDPSQFDQQLAAAEKYLFDHASDRDARLVLSLNYLFGGRPQDAVRTLETGSALADDVAAQKVLARAKSAVAPGSR